MSRCIVTGGAGFIGSTLVDLLLQGGHSVTVVDDLSTGKRENINPLASLQVVSLHTCKIEKLCQIFTGHEIVFHMASWPAVQDSIVNPLPNNAINVNGTLATLLASSKSGIRRLVYSASSSCYGNVDTFPIEETCKPAPLSPYALQKMIGEQYCKLFSDIYNLETVCLRYFNVYGKRMNNEGAYRLIFPIWKECIKNSKSLTITNDGNQTRDFVHALDVSRANIAAAFSDKIGTGDIINIGSGKEVSINDLAKVFDHPVEYIGERMEPRRMMANIDRAKRLLGWEPTIDLIDWVEKYSYRVKEGEREG